MGLWAQIKTWFFVHLLIGYVFVMSGLIVCFLMLLSYIFIWPFSKTLYRKIVVNLAYMHWSQMVFLGQWWAGCDCAIFMENIDDMKYVGHEHAIAIMNHKFDIDWMLAWMLSERFKLLGGTKIYGKQMLKFVPLIGWAWTFTESIFLKREWSQDSSIISRDLQYITDYPPGYYVTLLLFCEGTRFTEKKKELSNKVAREKGLAELKHHLLPRTKGFVLSIHGVKGKIPAILDLTVAFRKDAPAPTLMNILQGKPVQGLMYVRRIPIDTVPIETDEACAAWLHKFYKEKDDIYDNFAQNGTFTIGTKYIKARRVNDLLAWLFWAVLLLIPLFYYLGNVFLSGSWVLQISIVLVIVLATVIVKLMIGVTEIERGSTYGKDDDKVNGEINSNKKLE